MLELVVCRVRFARVSCPWLRFRGTHTGLPPGTVTPGDALFCERTGFSFSSDPGSEPLFSSASSVTDKDLADVLVEVRVRRPLSVHVLLSMSACFNFFTPACARVGS